MRVTESSFTETMNFIPITSLSICQYGLVWWWGTRGNILKIWTLSNIGVIDLYQRKRHSRGNNHTKQLIPYKYKYPLPYPPPPLLRVYLLPFFSHADTEEFSREVTLFHNVKG